MRNTSRFLSVATLLFLAGSGSPAVVAIERVKFDVDDTMSLHFSSDSRRLTIGTYFGSKEVSLESSEITDVLNWWKTTGGANDIAIASGSKKVAVPIKDKTYVYDNDKRSVVTTASLQASRLAISGDGTTIASALKNEITIWQSMGGKRLHNLTGHNEEVTAIRFSPGHKTLVSADRAGAVLFWNYEDGKLVAAKRLHSTRIAALHFFSSEHHLVSGSIDGDIKVWDMSTKSVIHSVSTHQNLFDVHATTNGRYIIWCDGSGRVALYDYEKKSVHSYLAGFFAKQVAISPDNRTMAIASSEQVFIVDLPAVASGPKPRLRIAAQETPISSLAFSRNGNFIGTSAAWTKTGISYSGADDSARVWNAQTGELKAVLDAGDQWHSQSIALSPNGSHAAVGYGRSVQLWKLGGQATMLDSMQLPNNRNAYDHGLAFVDETLLSSVRQPGVAEIWNVSDDSLNNRIVHEHFGPDSHVTGSITFSNDGKWSACRQTNGIWIRNSRTGQVENSLGVRLYPDSVDFGADGKLLVVTKDDQVTLHELQTMVKTGSFDTGIEKVSAATSLDGRWLFTAGGYGRYNMPQIVFGVIYVWDFETRQVVAALQGITAPISHIKISPDGRYLAAVSEMEREDKKGKPGLQWASEILIWDVASIATHVKEKAASTGGTKRQ